jgi:RNA recognition motif-containing protein
VGNLPYNTTEQQLETFLGSAGDVVSVALPIDRATGRPRGFAFVEFASEEQATGAISKFDGQDFEGRPLRVNMAEDRPRRPFGVGGGGPRPPFGGGGGGGGFPDDRGGGGGGGGGGRGGGGGGRPRSSPPKGSRRGLRARKRSL